VLSREELAQLSGLLRQSTLSDRCRAGVWLILATGVRVGELIGATWASPAADEGELMPIAQANSAKFGVVDLQGRTWQLRETKNQRAHTIHLSDFAIDKFCTLAKIQQTRLNGKAQPVPWILPNADGSGPVGVKTFGKQLGDRQREPERRLKNRTLNSAALALTGGRWTAHDLRRTAATLMAELGVSGDVIDECLNHQIESRVRRVYIRDRRIGEQAKAFDALGTLLTSIAAGSTTTSTESKAGETDAWPVNAVERRAVAV
jgi:integrase